MPIKGVSDKGLGFPQIGRIKKGEMRPTKKTKGLSKDKQVMRPVDLDYFKIEFEKGFEHLSEKFFAVYPPEPTSINIRLPFNDIKEMWDPFMEAYTASRMLARSDGPAEEGGIVLYRCDPKTGEPVVLNGKNIKTGEVEPHPADNVAGYDYKGNPVEYSPIGRLKVIVPELEEAGYMLMLTGSWNDCENISQQLAGIKELNNGVIKGVPLNLMRSDQKVMAPIDGKKVRVTKSLVSVIADSDWVSVRMAADKQNAFPVLQAAAKMLEPRYDLPENETEALPEITHPDNWGKDKVIEGEVVPETPAEAVIEPPQSKSTREPYLPDILKAGLQEKILKYDSLIEKDPGKYAVQVEEDRKVIASVVNEYIGGLKKNNGPRYAIFVWLLGEGKGSTKEWTPQEIGTIKNIWLKIGTFGDILGKVEEEELRQLWNHVQLSQGQQGLFG